MKFRDRVAKEIIFFAAKVVASKTFGHNFRDAICHGQVVFRAAEAQEAKTPGEPFAIQIGFNGHPRLSTLTKMIRASHINSKDYPVVIDEPNTFVDEEGV